MSKKNERRYMARKPLILSNKLVREAETHLSQSCKVMAQLVTLHGACKLARSKFPPFQSLVISIISQQLSSKAAKTIRRRVMEVVPDFSPNGFLRVSFIALRKAGLSSAKARYIFELAKRVSDGRVNFDSIKYQSDENVIATLTNLPGVGRWTSEMFLIFSLKRPDVLALGDAGLQRSARLLYGEGIHLENVGRLWKPYRSVASWYLWRHLDAPGAAGRGKEN